MEGEVKEGTAKEKTAETPKSDVAAASTARIKELENQVKALQNQLEAQQKEHDTIVNEMVAQIVELEKKATSIERKHGVVVVEFQGKKYTPIAPKVSTKFGTISASELADKPELVLKLSREEGLLERVLKPLIEKEA